MDRGSLNGRDLETIVKTAYQTLERYSGGELKLEITAIETIYPEQFGRMKWLDLVDMPDGRLVDVERQLHSNGTLAKRGQSSTSVHYRSQWRDQEKVWNKSTWGKALNGMTVDQVLSQAGSQQPELLTVKALTRYTVRAELGGQARVYRAAFLWIDPSGTGQTSFLVADNVVQNVDQAVRESDQPRGRAGYRIRQGRERDRLPFEKWDDEAASCESGIVSSYQDNHNGSGDGGHWSGSHSMSVTFYQTCQCMSDCNETCSASITSSSCAESGTVWDSCHKMSSSSASGSATSFGNGDVSPPSCGAGFICAEKSCLFCLCGLTVGANYQGPSVSFTSAGAGADWELSFPFSRTCPPCTRTTPPPPPPPPPGGGGGGGEGGGGGGFCDEDGDGWVTEQECYADCGGWSDGEYCNLI